MGSSSSTPVCTETINRAVRNVHRATAMSDRDRRLYNFAKIKIAEENLEDAEVTVDFQDQTPLTISVHDNHSTKVWIGLDFYDKPQMVWKKRSFWRNVKRFFIGCFSLLKDALLEVLAIGAGAAMKAITYFV